ncbi:MAG: 50S ribosomal protein L28 [Alphaproteobacteria bacterium]|nr:MAG: 50S ribosomal protein L28 [Alphaproteobacteria bacterium]
MSRRCVVTKKAVMSGNNVSHANNRTRRKFLPNITDTRVYSESLEKFFKIKVTAAGLRTLEHKGGFDAWLMDTAPTKLENNALRKIRTQVLAKKEAAAA